MKMIVGLGNPGTEYQDTRHNLGFMVVDHLHADDFSPWKLDRGAYIARGTVAGNPVLLVKPQEFMNVSGNAVQAHAAFLKIAPEDIVVIHDELDLPLGEIRCKIGGSSAGHNGIKSIAERLGTPEFWRIRIGMRSPRAETVPAEKFVLERFTEEEMKALEEPMFRAAKFALDFAAGKKLSA